MLERISYTDLLRSLDEPREELVMHIFVQEEARSRGAALSSVCVDREKRSGDRFVEIGIVKDDVRAFAAQLERNLLYRLGRLRHDPPSRRGLAGERDFVNQWAADQIFANLSPGAG